MLHTVKLMTTIGRDHELHLRLPPDTPTGEAEVIVLVTPSAPPSAQRPTMSLREFFRRLDAQPRPRLPAEEVDRWVDEVRNAWD